MSGAAGFSRVRRSALAAGLMVAASAALPAHAGAVEEARLAAHVRTLSSDAFQGRFPGTVGETRAVAYVLSQFKAVGLSPGGEVVGGRRTWFQSVPITKSQITGSVAAALTTEQGAKPWSQGEEIALRSTLADVTRVSVKDAPFVFVGGSYADPAKDGKDLEGIDFTGKVALFLFNLPPKGPPPKPGVPPPPSKVTQAVRQGAVGALFVHQPGLVGYAWTTVANSYVQTRFDIPRSGPPPGRPQIDGAIREDVAESLFRAAGQDLAALSKASQAPEFKPVALKGPTLSVDYPVSVVHDTSRTVMGRLAGTTHPDEVILYGAHWDHEGVGKPDATGDRIYHGALDNASGVASLIEIGRGLAHRPRTERSQVFVAWTLEEPGLLGSTYYADHPVYPLRDTVADITMDCMLPIGRARDFGGWGYEDSTLDRWLEAAGAAQGRSYQPTSHPERGYKYRSDHAPFARKGVPAVLFMSGTDLVAGGKAQGEAYFTDFFAHRYHQQSDRFDATWKLDGIAADVDLLVGFGERLGNTRDRPHWKPGSEFAAAGAALAGATP